jgi:hypothetical protein
MRIIFISRYFHPAIPPQPNPVGSGLSARGTNKVVHIAS